MTTKTAISPLLFYFTLAYLVKTRRVVSYVLRELNVVVLNLDFEKKNHWLVL